MASFDLLSLPYSKASQDFLSARYPGRITYYRGRSQNQIREYAKAAAGPAELEKTAELKRLAREFVLNDGFHQPAKPEMLSDDFVWFGPIVGPLNKQDFLGTVGLFAVWDGCV